ncbi:hypothetical protein AQUCO_01100218v1, partial [Aquilegia coerulea]
MYCSYFYVLFSLQCLAAPLQPQYKGGIIINPEFSNGLEGWSQFGNGKMEKRISKNGNSFVVAHTRNKPYDSFSQKLYMHEGMHYTFSAWIQVSEGSQTVTANVETTRGHSTAGAVVAKSGCWSMLKGGLTVESSGPSELYFESKNTSVEIWVDSVSLKPFTKEQWRSQQVQSIEKIRKTKVKIQATNAQGEPLSGAIISVKQNKPSFPLGSSINKFILDNPAYQKWFTSRFTVTTFTNEMKWYSTEKSSGNENYSVPDAMLKFAKQHGISVRGHNILWDSKPLQPLWVQALPKDQLRAAIEKRINSVVSRYANQLIAWDVVNENMHYSFFEDRFGKNFSALVFQKAHKLDSKATLFLNEYNTLEYKGDGKANPSMYLQKLRKIQSLQEKSAQIGIGVESRFGLEINIPYMRSALDTLAAAGLPIWLTELNIPPTQNQVHYLEEVLREAHSHPAVQGIVIWPSLLPNDCGNKMCLTDANFKNYPAGDVVDKLIHEWTHKNMMEVVTDSNGFFETFLYHGDYNVTIIHPTTNVSVSQTFNVTPKKSSHEMSIHH